MMKPHETYNPEIDILSTSSSTSSERSGTVEQDFYLYEHVTGDSFPTYKRTVKCLIIVLCIKGMVKYEQNDKTMQAKVGDLIILCSEQQIANQHPFYGFEGIMLTISEHILPQLPYQHMSYQALRRYLEINPIISLKQEEIEAMKQNLKLLSSYFNRHNNEQTILKTTQVLFNEFILSHKGSNLYDPDKDKSESREIVNRFEDLVGQNLRKRINVDWCCEQLKYSPDKLTKALKEYLNVTPHSYIILKKLNCSFTRLIGRKRSIHEISEELMFTSESEFCRTFKRYTNTTPLQFCRLAPDQQQDIIRHTIPYQISP